jgi:hypothetical protein
MRAMPNKSDGRPAWQRHLFQLFNRPDALCGLDRMRALLAWLLQQRGGLSVLTVRLRVRLFCRQFAVLSVPRRV